MTRRRHRSSAPPPRRRGRTIIVNGQAITLVEPGPARRERAERSDDLPSVLGRPGEMVFVGTGRSDLLVSEAGVCISEPPSGRRPQAWPEGGMPVMRNGRWL